MNKNYHYHYHINVFFFFAFSVCFLTMKENNAFSSRCNPMYTIFGFNYCSSIYFCFAVVDASNVCIIWRIPCSINCEIVGVWQSELNDTFEFYLQLYLLYCINYKASLIWESILNYILTLNKKKNVAVSHVLYSTRYVYDWKTELLLKHIMCCLVWCSLYITLRGTLCVNCIVTPSWEEAISPRWRTSVQIFISVLVAWRSKKIYRYCRHTNTHILPSSHSLISMQ